MKSIPSKLLLAILASSGVAAEEPVLTQERGSFTLEAFQVWKNFASDRIFNVRRLHRRISRCFDRNVEDEIHMMDVSDVWWRKVIEYGAQGGTSEDIWPRDDGVFLEHNPTPLMSESDLSKFPNFPPESFNITVVEPCNTLSNFAYYQAFVEVCEYNQRHLINWAWEGEWKTALIRAFFSIGPASLFFHVSGTRVGETGDLESIRQLAWLFLQYALSEIPYDPVLHDLQEEPAPKNSVELIADLNTMFLEEPVDNWNHTIYGYNTVSCEASFLALGNLAFQIIFYRKKIVDRIMNVAGEALLVDQPEALGLILENFSPSLRAALDDNGIHLGPFARLKLFLEFAGTMTKMLWAFVWQEEIIDEHHLEQRGANVLGSMFTPFVNIFGNILTGHPRRGSLALQTSGHAYPGDKRCNREQAHSKWHESSANALVDIVFLVAKAKRLSRRGGGVFRESSKIPVIDCFQSAWESADFEDSQIFSPDIQATIIGGILEECLLSEVVNTWPNFNVGTTLSCLARQTVAVGGQSEERESPLEICLVSKNCLVFIGLEFDMSRLRECVVTVDDSHCGSVMQTSEVDQCLDECEAGMFCAMKCLTSHLSAPLSQSLSCLSVLLSSNPSADDVFHCQEASSEGTEEGAITAPVGMAEVLRRMASIADLQCSEEHVAALGRTHAALNCLDTCDAKEEVSSRLVCTVKCIVI